MTTKRRSKLEERLERIFLDNSISYQYEGDKINYLVPESKHTYLVDWTLPNGLLLESKGYLSDLTERNKYILIKKQHPNIDLRFIFADPEKKCGGVKMTHKEYAVKNGFKYCSIRDIETIKQWASEGINAN